MNYIRIGKEEENLELILGGNRHGNKGFFVNPTIFKNVPEDSKLATEEIFGPVLVVMKPWKSLDEVI